MLDMFLYNWQVREDWFKWCESISQEELCKSRVGGMGSILKNLYHVVDCEQLWINQLLGKSPMKTDINSIHSLEEVIEFSNLVRDVTENFLKLWNSASEEKLLIIQSKNGKTYNLTHGKVLRHIISHEIHHIGQLSIWSRELGIKPVSSDLIIRDFT
ncbi:DinB family protein [Neobacillus sp. SCS-31]|uniref:DinB family protein n=1 Tax=Neobacillus oceani TaxID=3115292 RepID=UPI00390628C3